MGNHLGQHAVVIGGSMAGLITARVLADHFDHVTVLERDRLDEQPAIHKSIPQGNHYHALLFGGQQVLSALYPDFVDNLRQLGAVPYRLGEELVWYFPDGKAYSASATPVREPQYLGFEAHSQSRGLIEHYVRRCTLALANVKCESESVVQGLVYDKGRVRGVRYAHAGKVQALATDLVVDAGGRGSHVPRWLTELGYQPPGETAVGVEIGYASTKFRIPASYDDPDRVQLFLGPPPQFVNAAVMGEIEHHTWHVTLIGRFGQYPPTDEAGFLAFAQSLHTPRLYRLIKDAERVADIVQYRFPSSLRRHYERLTAFPDGLLVLGDAVCSFNPVYGQGMSVAALQVKALQEVLGERCVELRGLDGLAGAFFPKAADVIQTPWVLAVGQDLAYPQTTGERPPNMAENAQYFAALNVLALEDLEVHKLLGEVFQLAKPLSVLMEEPLRSRALEQLRKQANA